MITKVVAIVPFRTCPFAIRHASLPLFVTLTIFFTTSIYITKCLDDTGLFLPYIELKQF
jgi:hypothetical protein